MNKQDVGNDPGVFEGINTSRFMPNSFFLYGWMGLGSRDGWMARKMVMYCHHRLNQRGDIYRGTHRSVHLYMFLCVQIKLFSLLFTVYCRIGAEDGAW